MDDKKICFIMCVNDEQYAQEAIYYISRLKVPEGYVIDMLSVQDAAGMAAGYNEAMESSDAKYKVYLREDVMIVEPDFIAHLLELFRDPKIGMIGMVGASSLAENAVMGYSPRVGRIYSSNIDGMREVAFGEVTGAYQEVEAVDGLLMATQYDVRWREEVFGQWDFYDISQSLEFRKKEYKMVVPGMERPWVIHDEGFPDLENYYGERKKLLQEYDLAGERAVWKQQQYKEKLRKLQKLIDSVSKVSYHGVYLWKYVEYEIVSGIYLNTVNPEKNAAWIPGSDGIPEVTPEQIEQIDRLLNGLEKREVLFASMPLRRPHNGKLVHTAMDAYPGVLEEEDYLVLESGEEKEDLYTRNIRCYGFWGVVGKYGQDSVDKQELMDFLRKEYIGPIQMEFNMVYPEQAITVCLMKLSLILKIRKAFISFWNEVLERVRPKVICYTHGAAAQLCFVREAAMRKGVPTVEIVHGENIRNIIYQKTLALSDYLLTHSDLVTDQMKKHGQDNVFTAGKPGIYDNIIYRREEDGPIVISVISSVEQQLLQWTLNLTEKLEGRPYLVIYKKHSSEAWTEDEMKQVARQHKNFKFAGGGVDVRTLYEISDLVIGVRSSGLIDALPYCKIKILALEDIDGKEILLSDFVYIFQRLDELGDIVMVHDEEQLYREVVNYERGRDYRGTTNHFWPADSEKRFRDFIQIFLDGKRP